jgi:uncharacterized oligopeptide transporter (OPT) family protein
MHVAIESGAEAVEEGDGAEPLPRGRRRVPVARWAGRLTEESLDLVEEDTGEGRDGLGAVGEKAAETFRDGDDPLPHGHGRDDAVDEVRGGLRHAEGSLIMVAAGAIMGMRVAASMLVGSIIFYGVIGPMLVERGIAQPGYRGIVSWVLWPSTAMMVASGLLSFGLKWRTVARAFGGLSRLFGGESMADDNDPLAPIEVPASWFIVGTLVAGTACVILGHYLFDLTWWMGILAVLVTFLLSIVAARATGETDITSIGAMGKITQLIYGVVAPSNITTNLMTASITSGAASHAADLLTDLKSGYLLGGDPRKQTISQLFGVLAGTLVSVPDHLFVVQRNPKRLGSEALPALSAKVWAGVAELLARGIDSLPQGALAAIVVGAAIGIVLTLVEEFGPKS